MRDVEIGFKFHDGSFQHPRGEHRTHLGHPAGRADRCGRGRRQKLRQNRGQERRGRLQRAASAGGWRRELKLRFNTNTETERNQEKG